MVTKTPKGWGAPSARRYDDAARHSARVRRWRRVVPLAAIALFVAVTGAMVASRIVTSVTGLEMAATVVSDGKLIIAQPRMEGFTPDNRAYRVSAQSASQELGGDLFDLSDVSGNVDMDGHRSAHFQAKSATFDPDNNQLVINRDGMIRTSDGMQAFFSSADVDLAKGTLVTEEPVRVIQPGTEIVAQRLTVDDNGARIVFEHNVQMMVTPGAARGSQ